MTNTLNRIISFIKQHKLLVGLVITLPLLGIGSYVVYQPQASCQSALSQPPEEIKGKIITLKLLKEEHYVDYHNMFSNTVRKNLEFPEYITLGYTISYLRGEQTKAETGGMLHYCIFDNKDNKLIGSLEIREKNETDPGQFGCWINEAYWGGGRLQEAAKLIIQTYFRLKPHEKSFICYVRVWNKRSYHAMKKIGFKETGYTYQDGKPSYTVFEFPRP